MVLAVLADYTREMPGLADCGYESAGHGVLTPVKKPKGVKELEVAEKLQSAVRGRHLSAQFR